MAIHKNFKYLSLVMKQLSESKKNYFAKVVALEAILFAWIGIVIFNTLVVPSFGFDSAFQYAFFGVKIIELVFYLIAPFLITILYTKSPFISGRSVVNFLIYPIIFLVFVMVRTAGVEIDYGIFTLTILVGIVAFGVYKAQIVNLKPVLTGIIYVVLLVGIITFFQRYAGREFASVLSTDYIIHNSVTQNMRVGDFLGVVPSRYSNVFISDYYTVFYHTVVANFLPANFSVEELKLTLYALDFAFPIIVSLILFTYFKAKSASLTLSGALAALPLVIFDQGAFTSYLFLPQTFAWLMVLTLLLSEKTKPKELILPAVVILMAHTVIGGYLIILSICGYTAQWVFKKYWSDSPFPIYATYMTIGVLLVLLVNKGLVLAELLSPIIQSPTDAYITPTMEMFNQLFDTFNFLLALIPITLFAVYKKIGELENRTLMYLFIATAQIVIFLMQPVYPHKYLIGVNVLLTLLLFNVIIEGYTKRKTWIALLAVLLIGIMLPFYEINHKSILGFYSHYDGETNSIITRLDEELYRTADVSHKCTYISDPQTQMILSSLKRATTLHGNYIDLKDRQLIDNLVKEPTAVTYRELVDGMESESICLVYTSRLKQQVFDKEEMQMDWTISTYSYSIDTYRQIDVADPFVKFMEDYHFQAIDGNGEDYIIYQIK